MTSADNQHVDPEDLYADLGLTPHASRAEIARAYRALLRRHHPDTRPRRDNPTPTTGSTTSASATPSNETLNRAQNAYAVLGDRAQKADYDHQRGRDTTQHQPKPPRRAAPVTVYVNVHVPEGNRQPPIRIGPIRWHPEPSP